MKFGLAFASSVGTDPSSALEISQLAERAGFDSVWAGPHAEFHGEFVDFEPVTCSPRAVNGTIPILVGGDTSAAVRRAARIADGYFPGTNDPEQLSQLIKDVGVEAAKHGREPREIQIHAIFSDFDNPIPASERMAAQGVSRAMLPAFAFAGPGGLDRLAEFGERVIKPLGND